MNTDIRTTKMKQSFLGSDGVPGVSGDNLQSKINELYPTIRNSSSLLTGFKLHEAPTNASTFPFKQQSHNSASGLAFPLGGSRGTRTMGSGLIDHKILMSTTHNVLQNHTSGLPVDMAPISPAVGSNASHQVRDTLVQQHHKLLQQASSIAESVAVCRNDTPPLSATTSPQQPQTTLLSPVLRRDLAGYFNGQQISSSLEANKTDRLLPSIFNNTGTDRWNESRMLSLQGNFPAGMQGGSRESLSFVDHFDRHKHPLMVDNHDLGYHHQQNFSFDRERSTAKKTPPVSKKERVGTSKIVQLLDIATAFDNVQDMVVKESGTASSPSSVIAGVDIHNSNVSARSQHTLSPNGKNNKRITEHNYHDYAMVTPENINITKKGRGVSIEPFPLRLHRMLDNVEKDGLSSVVSWQPHGRCFVVHKRKQFIDHILPTYLHDMQFASFRRQLNLYGYSRLSRGRDKGGYYHELFLRGKSFLSNQMFQTRVKGTKFRTASNPETEPNFYAMSFVTSKDVQETTRKTEGTPEECTVRRDGDITKLPTISKQPYEYTDN